MHATSTGILGLLVVAAAALGGCRATTYGETEPVGYVEVTAAPVNVEAYPQTTYDGRAVYYVNDRWMYRDRGRWAYYRHEPPELYRHRTTTIQQAPPAYQQAPPAYPRYAPGGGYRMPAQPAPGGVPPSAPPAVRVQ